ncbi:hypothetical protein DSECCO2_459180 [anaerobic digester metagenome]
MPGLVLVADAQQVAALEGLARRNVRLHAALDLADHVSRRRLLAVGDGVRGPVAEKVVVRARPAQGHLQQFLGGLALGRVVAGVTQHAVGLDRVEYVVRPLLAALDLPGLDLVHTAQGAHQHVQGQVVAGEERAPLVLLHVLPPAGLHAAAAQAALAAQIAGPVAAARNGVAQGAVHEDLQAQAFGAVGGHGLDLVDGQLARQDQAVHAQGQDLRQAGDGPAVGQGREVQLALEACLTGQGRQAEVLHDEGVGPHLLRQSVNETSGLGQFGRLEQVVHGHVHPHAPGMCQFGQGREFGQGEVLRFHARGKILEAAVDGVGSGRHRSQKAVGVAGRGEDFRLFFDFHVKTNGPWPCFDARRREAGGAAAYNGRCGGRRTVPG